MSANGNGGAAPVPQYTVVEGLAVALAVGRRALEGAHVLAEHVRELEARLAAVETNRSSEEKTFAG